MPVRAVSPAAAGNFHAPFSLRSVCLLPLDKNHTVLEGTGGVWDVEYRIQSPAASPNPLPPY